jgi:hypothetical protein
LGEGSGNRDTNDLNDCLAGILGRQREWRLEAGVDVLEDDESLVRALALTIVLRGEGDLDGIRAAESDRLRERLLRVEPRSVSAIT